MLKLSERLSRTSGKKVYGYLKPDVKAIVDAIVAELAKDERIQKLYELWYEQREEVLRSYTDHFPERIPLEQNKEFKAIRNAVILEAMKIVEGIQQAAEKDPEEEILPFSDEPSLGNLGDPGYWMDRFQPKIIEPEPEDSADITPEEEPGSLQFDSRAWWSDYYMLARKYLHGTEEQKPDYEKAMPLLLLEASRGNGFACYDIGRMYLLGLGCDPDEEEAQHWFRDALEAFQIAEASDEKGYLRYRIGKCYAYGHGTEQNYEEAARWFLLAMEEGSSYAEYQLGKIYYFGKSIRADREMGLEYLKISAEHGNEYAANLLQVIHTQHTQGAASCAASLIARLGQIFQEQEQKQKLHPRMDRKQRRELAQKKQALGIRD